MDLSPSYPLTTERLRLAPLGPGDVDDLLTYRGRADVCRYLPFPPMTREAVLLKVAGDFARTELTEEGQGAPLVRERSPTTGCWATSCCSSAAGPTPGARSATPSTPTPPAAGMRPRPAPRSWTSRSTAWVCTASSPTWTRATRRRSPWRCGWECAARPTTSAAPGSRGSGSTPSCSRCWQTSAGADPRRCRAAGRW